MGELLGRLVLRAVDKISVRYWSPTRDWPPCSLTQLSYDMRDQSLDGVPLGVPLERLTSLGAADGFSRNGGGLDLFYFRLGLIVRLWEDCVVSFEVLLDPQHCPDRASRPFAPARLTVVDPTERRRDLTRSVTESEVMALFGVPVETGPVAGQQVHTFKAAGTIIETYHHPDEGTLVRVELCEADSGTARDRGLVRA